MSQSQASNPSLATAIARLERAGAENSRTTEKLRDAADALATWLENLELPAEVTLPRGYRTNGDGYLLGETDYKDCWGSYSHETMDRASLLKLAKDVAEGWLTEVAEWLEARAAKAERSAEVLAAALDQQQSAPALAIAAALEDLGNKADDLALTLPNGAEVGGLLKSMAYDLQDQTRKAGK